MERDYLSSLLNLFRKRINKIFVGLLIIVIAACDFENPSDFVVPTWFIDIKLPLVSKRFPMGDLVDTTNFIYPTDDSAGFQILLPIRCWRKLPWQLKNLNWASICCQKNWMKKWLGYTWNI